MFFTLRPSGTSLKGGLAMLPRRKYSPWGIIGGNQKAKVRKLITDEQYNYIFRELEKLPKEIHHLINYTNQKLKK